MVTSQTQAHKGAGTQKGGPPTSQPGTSRPSSFLATAPAATRPMVSCTTSEMHPVMQTAAAKLLHFKRHTVGFIPPYQAVPPPQYYDVMLVLVHKHQANWSAVCVRVAAAYEGLGFQGSAPALRIGRRRRRLGCHT